MTTFCPRCGHNMRRDAVVERPEIRVDPRGDVAFRGHVLELTPCERIILSTLVAAGDRFTSVDVLLNRTDSPTAVTLRVFIARLRRKLEAVDASFPHIQNAHGLGYRWVDAV